jgi:hypothetical protein
MMHLSEDGGALQGGESFLEEKKFLNIIMAFGPTKDHCT